MARKHTEQLALRPPAGTKDRLLAMQREGETLLSVVLRAIDSLEREGTGIPQRPLPGNDSPMVSDLERSLDCWLNAVTDTLAATLNRLDSLEARQESSLAEFRQRAPVAPPSEGMAEYLKNHPDMVEDVEIDDPPAFLGERTPDTQRCECRTTRGARCQNKTTEIIKARVKDHIAEFGSCERHAKNFEPYNVYL